MEKHLIIFIKKIVFRYSIEFIHPWNEFVVNDSYNNIAHLYILRQHAATSDYIEVFIELRSIYRRWKILFKNILNYTIQRYRKSISIKIMCSHHYVTGRTYVKLYIIVYTNIIFCNRSYYKVFYMINDFK